MNLLGEGLIVECELERDVGRVELELLPYELHLKLRVVEVTGDLRKGEITYIDSQTLFTSHYITPNKICNLVIHSKPL